MTTKALLHRLALAGLLAAGLGMPALGQDAGTLDKEKAERRKSGRPIRPTPIATSRRGRSSATRICTRRSRWMPARSAPGSSPRDAYRFARGEQVMASSGQPAKLSRPLDFLVVADHSDNMGFFPDLFAGKPEMLADPTGRKWYDMIQSGKGAEAALEIIGTFSQGTFPEGR